jgi:hypothetical protein
VLGLALVGSHARGAARPDSDVDVLCLCAEPDAFFTDDTWLARFGATRWNEERWGRVRTWRVWIDGGPELELNFATPDWASEPLDPGTRQVVAGGFRALFSRTPVFRALVA